MIATLLWIAASVGLAAYLAQVLAALRFVRRVRSEPPSRVAISVLKPLCGADDELEVNLASFLDQTHGDYELLLGCANERDPAWPIAAALARKYPGRVQAVVQQGEPGLNPKVNQLVTLARAARNELWVISDSNVRVGPDYLAGIAASLADSRVGLVTHPVLGAGGLTLGSRLDNLHLSTGVTVGVMAAKAALGQDLVVGKSMAVRRGDIAALGGFESVSNVLAEDFVLGRRVASELGLEVVLRPEPVLNITRRASLGVFVARYRRWSVMQRQAVGLPLYTLQALLHPTVWAGAALAMAPGRTALATLALCALVRGGLASGVLSGLARQRFSLATLLLSPLVELAMTLCWVHGLVNRRITWRGHVLRVREGSRLEPVTRAPTWKPTPAPASAR